MYKTYWNSAHPGHVVFLLDLSGSMNDDNKIDYAINALRATLSSINALCIINGRSSFEINDRISVSIYGYNYRVKNLGGVKNWGPKEIGLFLKSARRNGCPIFDKGNEAKPEGQTVMRLAFYEAKRDIEQWIAAQKNAVIPSPIVINITDGYPHEGQGTNEEEVFEQTLRAAKDLMSIRTSDGPVRIFNIHYSPSNNDATLRFPMTEPGNKVLRFLFNASSPVTYDMARAICPYFPEVTEGARAMISNEKSPENLAAFICTYNNDGIDNYYP